ncbi:MULTISPECIES: glycosyltransferase family 1 protein [unclassified Janthinobacterium]|uniref:glycosyltransferase family 4 protein n=1 Tax=unclassified Janthinobacterium TaxID=2610881 RepID=UPI00160D9667|nr:MULTISPECIES: glycosyltransferase family 1 protein [unclassified Janthinobacterium]MBB5608603.1 glycosyltransferase involved in cell wall biosynthesis [Janthinobacterium sp. S3T4]MBB5614124.1 glycosyltransferase involved in cell wall biosynthesis [Janthinobacterium sp. S3M3]
MKIYIDERWIGEHGIGRFANVLASKINFTAMNMVGSPSSPLDALRFFFRTLGFSKKDLVFSPGYNAPVFIRCPFVFTIHDLNHIDRNENSSFLKRLYYKWIMRRACRHAQAVLTVSEFSKRRIVDWSGIPAERVINVGNGVGEEYAPSASAYKPGYPYVLSVSNRKAHKNEPRLIEAFSQANISDDVRLLFTGEPTPAVLETIQQYKLQGRVTFVGRVAEADLPGLYRGALALAFPSLYEGFGLPVIEAMACGCPVLTSSTTSLPEVAGDAAVLVDPTSVKAIAEGISSICGDELLRVEMIRKGYLQAARFSWDEVVRKADIALSRACV